MTKDICCHFNPLSLYRERLFSQVLLVFQIHHFNPLSLYRERQEQNIDTRIADNISIHSPYTGRDKAVDRMYKHNDISIHSPYTGRDNARKQIRTLVLIFQSTLPIQGETVTAERKGSSSIFQSTLPIQGETEGT